MRRRNLALLSAIAATGLIALGSGTAWAGPGQHPTPTDCAAPPAGTACVYVTGTSDHTTTPIRPGDVVKYTFTLTNTGDSVGGAADTALYLDNDLEYVTGSARVDGNPITVVNSGGHPDLDYFPVPAHGTAVVTFSADVLAPLDGVPSAQTTYVKVSGLETSNDVVVSPASVDLAVSDGISEPVATHAANPGTGVQLDVAVDNHGLSSPTSTLSLGIPTGWTITSSNTGSSCVVTAGQLRCSLPAITPGAERHLQFVIKPGRSSALGVVHQVPVTLTPVGAPDQHPADNAFNYAVVNRGEADLAETITASATQVLKGGKVEFTVSLTNHGPNPSVNPSMSLFVDTQTDNGFSQFQPTGPGRIVQGGSSDPLKAQTPYDWFPGTIAIGQTVTLHVPWQANVLGAVGRLDARVVEDPYDASINVGEVYQVESAAVTVVSSLPASGGSSSTSGGAGAESGSSDPALAATGASATAPIAWGTGLIAAGALLLGYARRRVTR